ncbi:hypothetical protein Mterra_03020 [Calidithermus terrae]|uniref:Uncharacterized protein n=1 Tax=Calidithermus terrae TaxID=1408545 RepID=A0A399ED17_9DEIN|nr:hypothetical protein Mterra_03020 [Calidithermus terrae]
MGVRPQVNPNSLLGLRQGYSLDLATEHHIPMLSLSLHRRGLDLPFERAVELALDRADAVEEDPLPASLHLDPGLARLGEGERVVALPSLEAGVARFLSRSRLDPAEEALEGFVHPLDDVLQDLGVDALVLRQLGAYLGQPPFLLVEAHRFARFLVGLPPLLQGRVVQLAAQRKGALQVFVLGLGGVQAVLERLPSHRPPDACAGTRCSAGWSGLRCSQHSPRRRRASTNDRRPCPAVASETLAGCAEPKRL